MGFFDLFKKKKDSAESVTTPEEQVVAQQEEVQQTEAEKTDAYVFKTQNILDDAEIKAYFAEK